MGGRIVWISQDILFWGSVRDAARAAGTDIVRADTDAAIEAAIAAGDIRRVIVDLEIRSLDPNAAAARIAQSANGAELIGYASHVDTGALERARESGFREVMTRGRFHRSVREWITFD